MNRPPLILLHGALGAADTLQPLASELEQDFETFTPELPGHGTAPAGSSFTIEAFTGFLKEYIKEKGLQQPDIFGYSMGGYIALTLAAQEEAVLGRIITLGTKFAWSPKQAAKEARMLQPEVIEQKVPQLAETLRTRHTAPNDWKEVLRHTEGLMMALGANPPLAKGAMKHVRSQCMIMLGDRDRMVSREETIEATADIEGSALGILPATQHPIELVNARLVAAHVRYFLSAQ